MENKDKSQKSYLLCPNCNSLTYDEAWKLSLEGIPAPCCGSNADLRILWPRDHIQKIISAVCEQDLNTQGSINTAILGLSVILETLLEECLAKLLDAHTTDEVSKNLILDGARGLIGRIELYNKTSALPMEDLLRKNNFDGALKQWHILSEQRDRLVRNIFFKTTKNETDFLKIIRSTFLGVFVIINNDVARQIKNIRQEAGAAQKHKKFLIVDDEKETLGYLARIIKRQGHEASAVENGAKAIESYNQQRPDCVFLDVMLPDTDGMSILKQIVQMDPKANVYFVTGIDGAAFQKEAIDQGAKGVISKPINLNEIVKIIGTA